MLETFFICLVCCFLFSIAWFTPKAGTPEIREPLGKQFIGIVSISVIVGLCLSLLFGVFPN